MKFEINEKRVSRIAGHVLHTASENKFIDAFELDDSTHEFSEKDSETLFTDFLVFSIDYDAVLEYAQDWQGNLSANRYDQYFKEYLSGIISEKLLQDKYKQPLPDFSYESYDLFENRVCINDFSFNKLDHTAMDSIKSILDNMFLMN